MTALSEAAFRQMLALKGLTLDEKAFAAALQGARHLQGEMDVVRAYLAAQSDHAAKGNPQTGLNQSGDVARDPAQ